MAEKFNEHEKNTTSSSICADLEAGASDAKFAAENLALEDGSNKNIAENSEVQGKQSAALTDVDIGMRQDRDKDLNLPVSLTQAIKEDENRGKPLAFDIQTSDDTLNDKQEEERWEGKESFALTDVDIGMIQHSDKDLNSPVSVAEAIQKDENSANPSSYSVPIESSHPSRQPPNVKKSGKTSDDNLNEKSEKERWQDAAIFLNEGLDNDKFDNHPTCSTTIKWYKRAHSTLYNILDLMASTLLLSLALCEKTKVETGPTEDVLIPLVLVHGALEISILIFFVFGVFIKIKWQGVKSFFTHKRSLFKFIVLCIMCIEAIVVLERSENHIRITRALRPLFLIDSNYLRGTRRVLRQIVFSLPPILYMLLVLLFFIFIYSMLGFYLFSSNTNDVYFATFGRSFVSLFVLLTTANYPDVMMPSYAISRWSVIFFVTYVLIAIYFLMNLLLAVVYEAFTSIEKEKFKDLFLHKREAAIHAYKLLCNKDAPHWIALPQFLGLMKFFKPKHDVLQNYLVYKSLEKDVKGGLNLEEFYEVFEKRELVWRKVSEHDDEWFQCLAHKRGCRSLYYTLKGIHWLVTSKAFEIFIYVAIVANGCSFVYEIVMLSKAPAKERKLDALHSHWYNILFISIYGTEAFLKLLGLGIIRYFHSGWNWFDFIVTVLGIAGLIGAAANSFSFAFIVCLRPLRLLLLFKLKQRYRDVLDTMWVLTPRMFRVILVIMCIYYSFGIIGMECFAGLELKNCCVNISVGPSFEEDGYYYLNNFDDLLHAVVTLFELTVVNNWFIIMEGIVYSTSWWSRIYFMMFFIIIMVVMTIVVAFILEAFLFKMQYRKEHPKEETDMSIRTEVEVSYEELMELDSKFYVGLEPGKPVKYEGKSYKTEMDLSMKMYSADVEEWKKDETLSNLIKSLGPKEIRQDDSAVSSVEESVKNHDNVPNRTRRVRCSVPEPLAAHKKSNAKAIKKIMCEQSSLILKKTGILIAVGSPICVTCAAYLKSIRDNESEVVETVPSIVEGSKPMHDEESDIDSFDEVTQTFNQLKIQEENSPTPETTCDASSDEASPFLSPDTASTGSHHNKPLEKLNDFLVVSNIPPIQRRWIDWDVISEKTRQQYIKRGADIVAAVIQTISPENAGPIWKAVPSSSIISRLLGVNEDTMADQRHLDALAELYKNASSWDTRKQVLSIMTDLASYAVISSFIPGLSKYRYMAANLHRLQFGRGVPVLVQTSARIRIDSKQLDHFLSFITIPHLVQDLPFGQKHLTLSPGKVLEVPNVIRTMIPRRIVQQYSRYCEETNFHPLSESTMFRILSECSASVRKSLQGLDYFAADGSRAFDELLSLVPKLVEYGATDREWEVKTTENLKTSRLYLKGDYKVHLDNADKVADHCLVFSLSDSSDAYFKKECNHKHDDVCEQCLALEETLKDIEGCFKDFEFPSADEQDEVHYTVRSAIIAIRLWKCHILRSSRQDQARLDILELLDDKTVLIVSDWAMKFLPQKYKETQQDWFGKRGISWHISVVYRRQSGKLQWQGFVHIIQSCSQDSPAVVTIMEDVLRALKREHPEITTAHFRQNNASCYHSATTILSCHTIAKSSGVKIARLDFSDIQGGKGAADRLAATCKSHIRAYINEGNDVLTAKQLEKALLSHGGINGVRVVSLESIGNTDECTEKIQDISKMNNFEFMPAGKIKAWRAYGVGEGKGIETVNPSAESTYKWLESNFSSGSFKPLSQERRKAHHEKDQAAEKSTYGNNQDISQAVYTCPHDGCVRVFQRLGNLENHLISDKCTRTLEKHTLLDLAKMGYKNALEEGFGVIPTLQERKAGHEERSASPLAEGWALRPSKKAYRFSKKQNDYLLAKFEIGQSTGRKADANVVAQDMRRVRGSDDERLFQASEFLNSQQIASYFSRLAAKRRNQVPTEFDLAAIEEEINFMRAKNSAIESIGLQHPIVYDQYNICAMVENNTLENLKLGMLQVISGSLGLQVPKKPEKAKAPYLILLHDAFNSCSCQQ